MKWIEAGKIEDPDSFTRHADRTAPMSAMPPMGLALEPHDLRDLMAYLGTL